MNVTTGIKLDECPLHGQLRDLAMVLLQGAPVWFRVSMLEFSCKRLQRSSKRSNPKPPRPPVPLGGGGASQKTSRCPVFLGGLALILLESVARCGFSVWPGPPFRDPKLSGCYGGFAFSSGCYVARGTKIVELLHVVNQTWLS